MTDINKIAKEPLVWVAAAALCIPMLGPRLLNGVKNAITFESAVSNIAIPDPSTAAILPVPALPLASTELAVSTTSSPESPSYASTSVNAFSSKSPPSASKPAISKRPLDPAPEFDPGSLLGAMQENDVEDKVGKTDLSGDGPSKSKQPANDDEGDFDFLFGGDLDEPKADPTAEEPAVAKSKPSPIKPSQDTPETAKSDKPDWLFPPKDSSPSRPSEIAEIPSGSQSDIFFELDAGQDWWNTYCHQSITNLPAKQTGLDSVVFAAMQNSPFVKLINTEPQMAQTVITELDADFDWSTFVEASWNDTDRAVVSLLDTGTAGGRFVQQQLLMQAGVQKNLRTGGHLRVGNAFQRTDNNSTFLSPPNQGSSQFILDYRQPLMRGAGKHINNSQVVLAQIGADSVREESQVRLQQFLVDVVSQYWELYNARGVLVQRMRSAERADKLMQTMAELVEMGDVSQRELVRIQAVLTARQTDLIRAQNEVAIQQETLLNLTHGAACPDPSLMEIVPNEAPGRFLVPYDLEVVTEMAVQNRAEVQVALAAIRASAVRQDLALNDLKPQLDAVLSTFLSGVAPNKNVGDAFTDGFDNQPSYAIGLSFEVPIGRRASQSRLQRQQLEYQRLQYHLEQTLGNIRLDARLAYRNVQSLASELENHKLAASHAAKELEFVTRKTREQVGDADTTINSLLIDDLLQSQSRMAVAEERLLRSQTDLSVALVELKRATGQLLQSAPLPTIADQSVQQANFEQPASDEELWPSYNPQEDNFPSQPQQWEGQPTPASQVVQPPTEARRYQLDQPSFGLNAGPMPQQVLPNSARRAQRLPKRVR